MKTFLFLSITFIALLSSCQRPEIISPRSYIPGKGVSIIGKWSEQDTTVQGGEITGDYNIRFTADSFYLQRRYLINTIRETAFQAGTYTLTSNTLRLIGVDTDSNYKQLLVVAPIFNQLGTFKWQGADEFILSYTFGPLNTIGYRKMIRQ